MNNKAFSIAFDDKNKDFYPNDCQIDTSLDNDIIEFFKSQKAEGEIHNKSNKKENILNTKNKIAEKKQNLEEENNDDIEYEEDESSSSSELIYSTFPDNIQLTKKDIYEKMNINENIIKSLIEEYSKTKQKFLNEFKKIDSKDKSKNNIFMINHKEFNKCNFPEDNVIKNNILPYKSNEYLIKNINKCFKVLKNCNRKNNELGKLSEWIYTFLLFLEMPLSPDQNADLYSINKYIYNNFMKTSELKIIFIIICEIFKQILII